MHKDDLNPDITKPRSVTHSLIPIPHIFLTPFF